MGVALFVSLLVIFSLRDQNKKFELQLEAINEVLLSNNSKSRRRSDENRGLLITTVATGDQVKAFTACLLAIHGRTDFVSAADEARCRRIVADNTNGAIFSVTDRSAAAAGSNPGNPVTNPGGNNSGTPPSPPPPPDSQCSDSLAECGADFTERLLQRVENTSDSVIQRIGL